MGPLPWLTAAPGGTSDLHRYLGAQAARITLLAEQVAHQALDDGFPGQYWVRRLRRSHPELLARAAIWQAAHGAPLSHHRLVHADSNLEGSPYARDLSREIREALAVSRTAREFRSDQLRRAQSVAAIHL
jgi:hypothetical protein